MNFSERLLDASAGVQAKYSRKLGATKVYEKLDEQGRFICSLKFHLMWAEAYAQSGDLDQFTHVLNLARSRLAEVPLVELEMGFRYSALTAIQH